LGIKISPNEEKTAFAVVSDLRKGRFLFFTKYENNELRKHKDFLIGKIHDLLDFVFRSIRIS